MAEHGGYGVTSGGDGAILACPRCGSQVPEGIAFCPLCSKRVRRYDVPVGAETRMWGTAALVGAGIGATGACSCAGCRFRWPSPCG